MNIRGLTIVEILVVIMIASVLPVVFLQASSEVSEKDRIAVCAANMKKAAMATALYAEDNDEYLPFVHSPHRARVWNLLKTYAGIDRFETGGIHQCPSVPVEYSGGNPGYIFNGTRPHVAYNIRLGQGIKDNWAYRIRKTSEVKKPSSCPMFFDAGDNIIDNIWLIQYGGGYDYTMDPARGGIPRHDGINNIAFVDGSVRGVEMRPEIYVDEWRGSL